MLDPTRERDVAFASGRCYAEIDIGRIEKNFRIYKNSLQKDFRIIAVVKADGYGHGGVQVARCLEQLGVNDFAVATVEEGIALRRSGISGEILVLGYTSPVDAEAACVYGLTQTVVDEAHAIELSAVVGKKLKAQYAVDTGMRRIGLDGSCPELCERTIRRGAELFRLNGIFTHLSCADGVGEKNKHITDRQIERFAAVARRVEDLSLPYVHCLNSAGGLYYSDLPRGIGKFVRLGIALYGLAPSVDTVLPKGIEPALSWYAAVSSVRAVKKGEGVGYGSAFIAKRDCLIATLTVGYADGYSRAASGRAYVLINGFRAPIVGNVCMDQMMVDVTLLPHVRAGDRAVLIGRSGEEAITADLLGNITGTIGYEVVCGISPRVARKYI